MANYFNFIKRAKLSYSKFDLSHEHKTTFNAGKVIPFMWLETIPGDTFYLKANVLCRAQALIAPMMHREDMKLRFYFVPKRLLCNHDDLEKAYTGGESGDPIDFPLSEYNPNLLVDETHPYGQGTLCDYLGLPLPIKYAPDGSVGFVPWTVYPRVSPFPLLAYHRIYNDWLRNEETERPVGNSTSQYPSFGATFEQISQSNLLTPMMDVDGNSLYLVSDLHNIGWERDYFTSASKSSQRGNEVHIPLGGLAPIVANGPQMERDQGLTGGVGVVGSDDNDVTMSWQGGYFGQLFADLDTASGIGAIALRTYMNIQAYRERLNQSGYRLKEWIKAIFDQEPSDRTLDYCTYLGGASFPVSVSSVAQTSASTADGTPQANLAGIANAVGSMPKSIKFHCKEPGYLFCLGWVIPKTGYSQGIGREWTRHDWTEEFNPYFESVGEQEIKNQELYFNGQDTDSNDGTFGYQSRYSEYKYRPDHISGDFRTSLAYWHKSRLFTDTPVLNNDFVKCEPSDRVFAVTDDVSEMHYLADLWFDIKAIRPMHKYPYSKSW